MTLGIVVIGRNEGERLVACFASLRPHGYPVVYVDSGSTDGSVEAACRFGFEVVSLDATRPFTAARGRNAGLLRLLEHYPGIQFVHFIDGDCVLTAGWLCAARSFLIARPNCAVVCGRRRERSSERSVYNWLCDLEWDTPPGETMACGGDALMRVAPLLQVGGYREDLIAGEEPELCVRLRSRGWKIWRLCGEMTVHDAAMTRFGQWWRRMMRGGHAFAAVSALHWRSTHPIWRRELARAVAMGGAIPAAAVLGFAISPYTAALLLVYPVQIIRIAFRRGWRDRRSWTYAGFMILAKFAECFGAIAWVWGSAFRSVGSTLHHKL